MADKVLSTAAGSRPDAFGPAEWGLVAAPAVMWGSSFLFIAEGIEAFDPAVVTLARIAFGLAALSLFPAARRRVPRSAWPRLAVLGVTWMAFPLALFPIAQQWINSSLTGMLNAAMPLFAAAIAAVLLQRLPGRQQAAGLAVGFAGVLLVGLPSLQTSGTAALGVALVLIATLSYGFSVNLAVPVQQSHGALPVIWRVQVIALVLSLPLGLLGLPKSGFAWSSFLAVAALGVFGTAIAFVAMATLVGRTGATRGSIVVYFIPIVAVVLGVVFRNETVEPISLVGMALVLAGAYLASRREGAVAPARTADGA